MFRPQKVYLNSQNNQTLNFDLFTDIQPITPDSKMKPEKQSEPHKYVPPHLDNQAEAMAASIGQAFDCNKFVQENFSDHKTKQKALEILSYLQGNTDPSNVRFGTRGGLFYKGAIVPDANLSSILKNMVTKKSKTLQQGEFYLLSVLANAPASVLKNINPAKLKMCNVQQTFSTTGLTVPQKTPQAKPDKVVIPPSSGGGTNSNVEFRTANPFVYKPTFKHRPTIIAKPPTAIPKKKTVVTGLQKKYNVKAIPAWYKVL